MIDMGDVIHLLYFRLFGAERFKNIHGEKISGVVQADLTRRFAFLFRELLRQHEVLADPLSPAFGLWAVPFKLKTLEIDAGEAEQLESIVAAGRELGYRALEEELGTAVALHARLEVGALMVEKVDGDPAEWMRRLNALPRSDEPAARGSMEERTALRGIIAPRMDLRLQEIVSLETKAPAAFEALVRGPEAGPWHEPDRLFEAAVRCGLRADLELACFESALVLARRLPVPYRLAVNLSPDLYGESAVQGIAAIPGLPERLILEITEHLPIPSPARLLEQMRPLRVNGAKIALDDAGCGYLNMELVRALKPDIVKLCITLTRRIDAGSEVLDLIRKTVAAIRAEGAEVLAEGVENETQARLARECGCSLAQGFYFDKPKESSAVISALAAATFKLEHPVP
jgi:EAL domain-containing protein (putative c-di-GMP-specific phosphodiesterase class I)